ncbi:type II secretion system F family protein [Cupriavidus cauae]|uniref:type II secretion system F family protein n=1 Tax=Cupriavidus cauae TaxID=2608999 RepID=UPI0022436520|nr:type II secretion system F family protein [Cupriavidus cauae]
MAAPAPRAAVRRPAVARTIAPPRIRAEDIARFTRQLSTLLGASVPLLPALDIIARGHGDPAWRRLLAQLRGDIESGSGLAQAMRRHPRTFDALYCSLVDAGEQGGALGGMLDRLCACQEQAIALRRQVRAALRYPLVVLAVAAAVTTILMLFVIPAFKQVFVGFGAGAQLPTPTQFVIALSDGFVVHWQWLLALPPLAWLGLRHALGRSPPLRHARDRALLLLPLAGPLLRKAAVARWTRTLATLSAAGTPVVEAMALVAGASGNRVYRDATRQIERAVRCGASLATAMRASAVFDPMALQMTRIGEESGALDTMLLHVAQCCEREVDEGVAAVAGMVEPLIVVVLGVLIGGLVIAMYLPIFKLAQVV